LSSPDFLPTSTLQNLRLRAGLLRKLREFFLDCGFLEVETPILSADTVVDRHLDPFSLNVGSAGQPRAYWLQTSPEFAMKRLLAAGAEAIYQVSRVFRREEQGPLHNPEFTLVEWYQTGDDYAAGMRFTSDLCEALLGRGPAELLSYAEAFQRHVGLDPHAAPIDSLIAAARQRDPGAPGPPESLAHDDRDGWLDWLISERIQMHLGIERPLLLYDFPADQAALAQVRPGPPPLAERFELYVGGWELANGYHELRDAAELRRRNARANELRLGDGKAALPAESRLLAAMEQGLPSAVGCALGFDRLVMLAAGARSIDEVIAFPWDRA
jgi:elongation factor P--(R)-beta-lysine ligase